MSLLLCKRIGLPIGELVPDTSKMILASVGMILPCAALRWGVPWPDNGPGHALALLAIMSAGGVTYFSLCFALRLPMNALIPARLRRRQDFKTRLDNPR